MKLFSLIMLLSYPAFAAKFKVGDRVTNGNCTAIVRAVYGYTTPISYGMIDVKCDNYLLNHIIFEEPNMKLISKEKYEQSR